MSIQIKEIIASDTISGLVEKLNYNFDQILLNGGGPRGPQGTIGAKGNIGDRGIRGNIWIVQDFAPDLNNDDYIPGDKLVLNTGEIKTVVELNGVKTWESTNVNIKGETGEIGDNGIVSYITHGANTKQIVHFKKYEYNDSPSTSISSISTVLLGGASSITGAGLDAKYIVPGDLLSNPNITNTSLLIHSNSVDSKAIVFTGHSDETISHTADLNAAAYIRLSDNDSIRINAGEDLNSSITLGKNIESYITIGRDDLSISHSSKINIKRAGFDIIKIASSEVSIPSNATAENGSVVLDAMKIGVLAKDLYLNSVNNYIRLIGGPVNENILAEANAGDINIHAFDKTVGKGKIAMLGNGNIALRGIDIDNNNTLTYISAIEFIKDYNELKNRITLKSNEIILSTSRYKNINSSNEGLDTYIHIKNGDYALDSKGIDLVTNSGHLNLVNNTTNGGSIILRNGEANINNVITLDRTNGNNYVLIAGVEPNKPGIQLDNVNNNVQIISKTIWNDGESFIDVETLPNLKSVHIRKNTASPSPNLILSSPNNLYSSSRLLYGYQGNTATGHTTTMQSITVNPGSVKLSYGPGNQHYNDQTGYNQGFVIRSFEYPIATSPGFKIIDGRDGETNIPLSIDKNLIWSQGSLIIGGDSDLRGNCNVGEGANGGTLTAANTAIPGILYSCRLTTKTSTLPHTLTHSHIWGPIGVKTSLESNVWSNAHEGPRGVEYFILFNTRNTPSDPTVYNGIELTLYRINDNGISTEIDLSKDFTVQVTPIKDDISNVFLADYVYNNKSLIFYTYKFDSDTRIKVYANPAINITIIGPIVKFDENGNVLWDFR